jgi:argininosuccinate lyase
MPQKKNPCMLELIRAKAATVGSCSAQVKSIIRALPSGYNRDFQETKGPYLHGLDLSLISVRVMKEVIDKLQPDAERLRRGLTPDIFATDRALELVARGMPFREAYRSVGSELEALEAGDPDEAIRSRRYTGTTGNLGLDLAADQLERRRDELQSRKREIGAKLEALAGIPVSLYG